MAGIEIKNGVANAGGLPAIFAGPSAPTLPAYSLWLETTTNTMFYFNGGAWVAIGSSPATPNLEEVLGSGNTTTLNAVFNGGGVYAGAFPLIANSQQSFVTEYYNGMQMIDGSGTARGFTFYANSSVLNRPYLLFGKNSFSLSLIPPDISANWQQNFVEANGNIYPGLTGTVTLSSGLGTISYSGITAKSTITFSTKTGIGTLGVTYQGSISPGSGVQVTALKTNNTTETSDNSILYYQIWNSPV